MLDRVGYIEGIIESLRVAYLNGNPPSSIEFDKARLSSNVGLLIHETLKDTAVATKELTQALREASSSSSRAATTLNWFTFVLAVATLLLVGTGIFQGLQSMRQADVAEKQLTSVPTDDSRSTE